ncbi:hypothetical protein CRG98_011652 [Punica granatum]|uniref:Uncharacterized protein n=1 Tax=Punica granatum TaxID=22663 RepID=A0A2I0KJS8_PUNGR|nr:hypothetical protein CRG98_011652 [Punica granatum]
MACKRGLGLECKRIRRRRKDGPGEEYFRLSEEEQTDSGQYDLSEEMTNQRNGQATSEVDREGIDRLDAPVGGGSSRRGHEAGASPRIDRDLEFEIRSIRGQGLPICCLDPTSTDVGILYLYRCM